MRDISKQVGFTIAFALVAYLVGHVLTSVLVRGGLL
jgi:hypothetical protein